MTITHHGALAVRHYVAGDEPSILATFNLVFRRECGPTFVDRDLEYWRWQFLDNPAGTQILLAVDQDGTVASQYAAIPQTTDTPFGALRFVHVVDSMTHPAYRQALQREGPFAVLGREFTADHSKHGNEVGYGFPVRVAERIGARLLDYRLLRTLDYLVRPCSLPDVQAPTDVRTTEVEQFPSAVDALWHTCLPRVPCAVRRDHRYLDWRYVRIPTRSEYARICAWRGDELSGVAVVRRRLELVPGSCGLVDWVCRDDDEDTATALLAAATDVARAAARDCLMAVFAEHDPAAKWMQAVGATATPSSTWHERRLTYRITGPFTTPELLASAWRYTLGDTDLC